MNCIMLHKLYINWAELGWAGEAIAVFLFRDPPPRVSGSTPAHLFLNTPPSILNTPLCFCSLIFDRQRSSSWTTKGILHGDYLCPVSIIARTDRYYHIFIYRKSEILMTRLWLPSLRQSLAAFSFSPDLTIYPLLS